MPQSPTAVNTMFCSILLPPREKVPMKCHKTVTKRERKGKPVCPLAYGNANPEGGTTTWGALGIDRSTVELDDFLGDGKT